MSKEAASKRPGRPAKFSRQTAIGQAMAAFWKRGFAPVSASDIAAAMAITRSSFYNSFADRESVFREAMQLYAEKAPDAPLHNVKPGEAVTPVVVKVFRDICRIRAADAEMRGCLIVNSVAELVGVNEELGPFVEQALSEHIKAVARLLRQAVEQGELPPAENLDAKADALVAFQIGLNLIAKVIRDEAALWAMCREVLISLGFRIEEAAAA